MANACQLAKFHLPFSDKFAPRTLLRRGSPPALRSIKQLDLATNVVHCCSLNLSEGDISEPGISEAYFVPKVIDFGTFRIRPMSVARAMDSGSTSNAVDQ